MYMILNPATYSHFSFPFWEKEIIRPTHSGSDVGFFDFVAGAHGRFVAKIYSILRNCVTPSCASDFMPVQSATPSDVSYSAGFLKLISVARHRYGKQTDTIIIHY